MNDQLAVQLTHSVATLASNSVLTRLFSELDVLHAPEHASSVWFGEVLDVLTFSQEIEIGFGHARAYALAILKENWDSVDLEVRKQYGYTFDTFSRNVTGKEGTTIDNYVRTAKIWFIDKTSPGRQVELVTRDIEKRPIRDEKGRIITTFIDFVPYTVDLSKLLAVNSRAASGSMTSKLWEMLVDDFYTCSDIQLEAAGKINDTTYYRPSYFLLGPGLYVESGGVVACVAEELNWAEYESNDIVKEAIDLVLKVLNVLSDADRIHELGRKPDA